MDLQQQVQLAAFYGASLEELCERFKMNKEAIRRLLKV